MPTAPYSRRTPTLGSGDTYAATQTVHSYDAAGNLAANPATPATLVRKLVTLP